MASVLLICAGLLGVSSTDRTDYQAAVARAGHDAEAHLKLAVWCDAHGLDTERVKHLAMALAIDPQNPAVRGLMGLVAYGGRWLPPEKVSQTVSADDAMAAKLAEYEGKRQSTPDTAEAQWQLALWCENNGLKAEATAHFTAVTQLDPKRADAWHKLGCAWSHGRWIRAEEVAAERAEEQVQEKADRHWRRRLAQWKRDNWFPGPQRDAALAAMKKITDPRAVPAIHWVFGRGNRFEQEMAAQLLSQIQCPAASQALAALALCDAWPDGRTFAIQELKRRDPRDYMDGLIALMHRPFAYHVSPIGSMGEPGGLVIDGDSSRMQRVYPVPGTPAANPRMQRFLAGRTGEAVPATGPTGPAGFNPFFPANPAGPMQAPALIDLEAARMAAQARANTQRTMLREIQTVDAFNTQMTAANRLIGATLREITGQQLGDDPDAWLTWWNDKLGLRVERTPARYRKTTTRYVASPTPVSLFRVHQACFAAGTPVWTLTGPRPIESLAVGDVVLSQDTQSGVLGYRPILGIHHNPPAQTVRIRLKDETVISTPVHRFWRPGLGWAMARDLKPGDSIRTVGGRAEILEIRPDVVQPVFNLDVARDHSFFVGSGQILVRDNSLPPAMFTPFDAEPALAAIAARHTEPSQSADDEAQPSPASQGAREPGWIWDSPGAPAGQPRASKPGQRAAQAADRFPW